MEFVFVFPIVLIQVVFINFTKIVKIIRALGVDTLMDDEVLAFFLWNKGICTVRAPELEGGKTAFFGGESGVADLAENLPFGAIVFVQERLWGIAARTAAILRDITFGAAGDRTDFLTIAFFEVRDQFLVGPALAKIGDERKCIRFEFLMLRGVGILKSPLPERGGG